MPKFQGQIFSGLAPVQGPKCLGDTLDFSAVAQINLDLTQEETTGQIDYIQTLYVNNSDNLNALEFLFEGTNQLLTIPAGASGIWPVFVTGPVRCKVTTTIAANLLIPILWINVPMPLTQWGPQTVNIAAVTATFAPTVAAWNNFSGNTAVASAALFAAKANAKRRIVINPASNPGSLWINFGGVAAVTAPPSIEIPPGATFDSGATIDQTDWTIIAAAVMPYAAKEC